MRVLVTNDDGVNSPGIHALAAAMATTPHDVFVAAPSEDMSGTSSSIGRFHVDRHIDVDKISLPGAEGLEAYAVVGPPALCVITAQMGGFGDPPDLVVSGINPGPNTGGATLHSGTVGAALTGANFGLSGLAVSMAVGKPYHWETAAVLAVAAFEWLADQPPCTVLNLNVPNVPLSDVKGVRWGGLARFGSVRTALIESQGGRLQMEFSEDDRDLEPGTDAWLVRHGYASVTTLTGVEATAPPADVADAVAAALGPPR